VSVLAAHSGALLRTVSVAGKRPNGIVVDERRGHLLIVNSGSVNGAAVAIGTGSVSMLDARTGAILHVTRVGTNPGNVAMDEMTERAFVVDSGATFMSPGSVSVLDVRDGRLLRTVPVGQGAGTVVVDERAGRIFVNTRSGLRVLDAKSGRVVGILPVDGRAMAVDTRANRVFALGYGNGTTRGRRRLPRHVCGQWDDGARGQPLPRQLRGQFPRLGTQRRSGQRATHTIRRGALPDVAARSGRRQPPLLVG
jgi:DNA-binding beta-propeller fold protein YncE